MALTISDIAQAALASWGSIVDRWLPGGKMRGAEYEALNPKRGDEHLGSFRLNTESGLWADFATDASGGDLVALVAYLDEVTQLEAARRLADFLGLEDGDSAKMQPRRKDPPAAREPAPRAEGKDAGRAQTETPDDALSSRPDRHPTLGAPAREWAYRDEQGAVVFFVLRFEKEEGGKEFRPLSLDAGGKWRWKMPKGPAPLRGLDEISRRADADLILCEGEKAADAAARLFPHMIATCTPGGSAAARRADYACLAGRRVFIWPDADQPGMKYAQQAMKAIKDAGGDVHIIDVGSALDKGRGWDAADAEEEGEGGKMFLELARAAEKGELWQEMLMPGRGGVIAANSFNVRLILQHRKEWAGAVAYDEMAHRVTITGKLPFPCVEAEDWGEIHDIEARHWIAANYGVEPAKSDLSDGIVAVAMENRFHPVRDYLDGLTWDGISRIDSWLSDYLGGEKHFEGHERKMAMDYCRMIGSKFLIGSVARVRKPGCKMDNVLILEGKQGAMKSRALAALWGEKWVSDSEIKIGDKDGMAALQGVWLVELAELDSLLKSSPAAAKSFFSSGNDRFRPPYGARTQSFPRQVVFAGTTNPHSYLEDGTGNRRYWPCYCSDIDLNCLKASRDQLWAEADVRFKSGDSWWIEGQESLVERFQSARLIGDPWENILSRWLADWWANKNRGDVEFVAADQLFSEALELPAWKRERKDQLRLGQVMSFLGWSQARISTGGAVVLTVFRPGLDWVQATGEEIGNGD